MPLFQKKKGGKHERKKKDCSYENIDYDQLPKLHSLVLGEATTGKLKGHISKKVSNIDEADKHGRSALHYAASIGNEKAIFILLQCGLTINLELKDEEGKTPLFKAVEVFSANCVHALLEHQAQPDVWDNHESTPLHIATVNRKTVIISLINNAHGDLNVKDKMGFTPLHVAAAFGYLETAKELIDSGASINATDNLGRTPLMAASCEGTPKMVHLLLGYGADPTLKDNFNHTAIDHSKQNPSESMTMIIKEAVAQRGYASVNSTEAEPAVSADDGSGSNDADPEVADNPIESSSELGHEVVLNIESIDTSDGPQSIQEPQDQSIEDPSSELIEEDIQKATDVRVSHAAPIRIDQDTVPSETPASNETLKEQMILGDVAIEPADRIMDESSRLLQDSLQVLKKKKGDKPRVKRKSVSFASDAKNKEKQKLLLRNRELKKENDNLKDRISESTQQASIVADKQQREFEIKKSQLQFVNIKNRLILEDKIKQCSKLEVKLKEAYDRVISEIEKAKEGSNLDTIAKDTIRDLNSRLKSSEAKSTRLLNQLKSSREGKSLLETQVGSLKGQIVVLKQVIEKHKNEPKSPQNSNKTEVDNETLRFYEEEYERNTGDNEALQGSLNDLRRENAMLKEQHISDKHEAQMIRNELTEAQEQILTLQYQLENIKNQNRIPRDSSYRDSLDGNNRGTFESLNPELMRVRKVSLGRAQSDSTLHGFRTFDSAANVFSNKASKRNVGKYRAADLFGME